MKALGIAVLIGLFLIGCSDTADERTMTVTGNIKGLKKGTLFLQHLTDSVLVTVDSLEISGDGHFTFHTPLESPDLFYLYLDKEDNNDINDRITFFGEPGTVTINTAWNTFDTNAQIEGSETHEKLEEYQRVMSRFNRTNLELMQMAGNSEQPLDSLQLDSLQRVSDNNMKRGYAFALNFALNNTDSYIAPYVALIVSDDANRKYLDSIYGRLSPEVAASKYGRALRDRLKARDTVGP